MSRPIKVKSRDVDRDIQTLSRLRTAITLDDTQFGGGGSTLCGHIDSIIDALKIYKENAKWTKRL